MPRFRAHVHPWHSTTRSRARLYSTARFRRRLPSTTRLRRLLRSTSPPSEPEPRDAAELFQRNPHFQLEAELDELARTLLEMTPAEVREWLQSDEVEPYWKQFREIILHVAVIKWPFEPPLSGTTAGPSMEDYEYVKIYVDMISPSARKVSRVVYDEYGDPLYAPGIDLWLAKQAEWPLVDHWAWCIVQICLRAWRKTEMSGDDVPAKYREFPSLWPATRRESQKRDWEGLYLILRWLVTRHFVNKVDKMWAEKYRDAGQGAWSELKRKF